MKISSKLLSEPVKYQGPRFRLFADDEYPPEIIPPRYIVQKADVDENGTFWKFDKVQEFSNKADAEHLLNQLISSHAST